MVFHDRELDLDYRERRLAASAIQQKLRREMKKQGITHCTCEVCKKTFEFSSIELHHIEPIAEGGKADGKTVTLCLKCHYGIHGKSYDPKSIIIDEEEWLLYALQGKNQKDIAKERGCTPAQLHKAWEEYKGREISWPQYKISVRRRFL